MLNLAAEKGKPVVVLRYQDDGKLLQRAQLSQLQATLQGFRFEFSSLLTAFMLPPGAMRVWKDVKIPMLKQHLGDELGKVCHKAVAETPQDMMQELTAFGFVKESLPTVLGGTWSQTIVVQEPQQQRQPLRQDLQEEATSSATSDDASSSAAPVETEQDRKDRKRKRDAAYSKIRRKRNKQAEQELLNDRYGLDLENKALKDENKRLVKLVQKAKALAQAVEAQKKIQGPAHLSHVQASSCAFSSSNLRVLLQQLNQQKSSPVVRMDNHGAVQVQRMLIQLQQASPPSTAGNK
jgi:hypothetical protein